jgi:two-component system chemotaxis sensor kinase CheA
LTRVALIDELFRSYHTLKGLSGMVGLAQAEQLSHALESVLRAVQHMQIDTTPQVLDRLFAGTHTLEAIIASLDSPDEDRLEIETDLAALAELLTEKGEVEAVSAGRPGDQGVGPEASVLRPVVILQPEVSSSLSPLEQQQLQAAQAAGRFLALAIFTPDPARAGQGHNVNSVREALRQAGELIKAVPLIEGSNIQFAFLVASSQPLEPQDFPAMEWTPLNSSLPENETSALPDTPLEIAAGPDQPGAAAATSGRLPAQVSVRVDLARLDELMQLVSELVITRYQLNELLPGLAGAPPDKLDFLEQRLGKLDRSLRDLRQAVVRARMVPLAEVFSHMPLAVRDLARASGKEVRLAMHGERTEVDKQLVESLLDPLLHLVRNAITHGLETPGERLAAGKPKQGTLTLGGHLEGDHIRITVADDGPGIDVSAVAAKAAALGWLSPERAAAGNSDFGEEEILELLCRPGFSTWEETDLGAGRGVGMDVVRRMVVAVGGSLGMRTAPGEGTEFTLWLPLTLTILDALIVCCGKARFAIPRSAVDRVVEIDPAAIVRLQNGELYPYHGDSLRLLRLANLLHLPSSKPLPFFSGLISVEGDRRTVLLVDRILGLREVVVRTISDPLVARLGIAGATELGDGQVILILDIKGLFQAERQG